MVSPMNSFWTTTLEVWKSEIGIKVLKIWCHKLCCSMTGNPFWWRRDNPPRQVYASHTAECSVGTGSFEITAVPAAVTAAHTPASSAWTMILQLLSLRFTCSDSTLTLCLQFSLTNLINVCKGQGTPYVFVGSEVPDTVSHQVSDRHQTDYTSVGFTVASN